MNGWNYEARAAEVDAERAATCAAFAKCQPKTTAC